LAQAGLSMAQQAVTVGRHASSSHLLAAASADPQALDANDRRA